MFIYKFFNIVFLYINTMKYLKRFNENFKIDEKEILRFGFETLMDNTHLVEDQVNDNLDKFLDELNLNKLETEVGKIVKFLGAGVFGAVFQLESGKAMKITFDFHEAPFVYKNCKQQETDGLVKVDEVYKIKFGDTNAYIIIRDSLTFDDTTDEEKQKAKDAMYKISPVWRGTHPENFGRQNGKVVLYDGFCKKAPVDETEIPFLDLN